MSRKVFVMQRCPDIHEVRSSVLTAVRAVTAVVLCALLVGAPLVAEVETKAERLRSKGERRRLRASKGYCMR